MADLKKWRVYVPVGSTVGVVVQAEDAEAAIAAVTELPQFCAQCSGWGQNFTRDEWEPDWDHAEADAIEDGE